MLLFVGSTLIVQINSVLGVQITVQNFPNYQTRADWQNSTPWQGILIFVQFNSTVDLRWNHGPWSKCATPQKIYPHLA